MQRKKIIIYPSVLSCNLSNLSKEVRDIIDAGADAIHMDIMDGNFVPSITFGLPVLKSLKKSIPNVLMDCHLMVNDPLKWIKDFAPYAYSLSFHIEACCDNLYAEKVIHECRVHNIQKVGIALKPKTDVSKIINFIPSLDYILVMTVEPGFSGQKFINSCLTKITKLNKYDIDIQVDGGINLNNINKCYQEGANIIVSGSSIFGSKDPGATITRMKSAGIV